MKEKRNKMSIVLLVVSAFVFVFAIILLFVGMILGEKLGDLSNLVVGIRLATVFVAFSSFMSSSVFSMLIYRHNKSINEANKSADRRAELFRDLQFVSSNYSIIEFMDRMLISVESKRYIEKFIFNRSSQFHLVLNNVDINDCYLNPDHYEFVTLRIPFRVSEGKIVSRLEVNKITFERDGLKYQFIPADDTISEAFLLFNERTKRRNMILNLVVPKNSNFFIPTEISIFSKIKMRLKITSVLGVMVSGISELYFTNPEQIEGDGTNTYRINSSSFYITETPQITRQILSSSEHEEF